MNPTCIMLAASLCSSVSAGHEGSMPVAFCRAGQTAKVRLPVTGHPAPTSALLRAFGRDWSRPLPILDGYLEGVAPETRVPVVIRIVDSMLPHRELGKLIVYPKAPAATSGGGGLYSAGTPDWFNQWCDAVGLKVQTLPLQRIAKGHWPRPASKHELLILGKAAAGRSASKLAKLAEQLGIDVLVLDAGWFPTGQEVAPPLTIRPDQAAGPLSDLKTQRWSSPPEFSSCAHRIEAVCNRQPWLQANDRLVVERISWAEQRNGLVLSYLPWWQQLGRCAVADFLLMRVLQAAAQLDQGARRSVSVGVRYPESFQKERLCRPVLMRLRVTHAPSEAAVQILDLRGDDAPPDEVRTVLKHFVSVQDCPSDSGHASTLLVLGDDPALDRWPVVKVDRKKRSLGHGIAWLPDDALPPSSATRIELSVVLTQLRVPIWEESQECKP